MLDSVIASVGDTIEAKQNLMILEYNKVVTEVTAPAPSTVVEILCQLRDEVQVGERLINIRPY